ncbi:MAG: sugar phosphate nucleotidyltransferase [Firmicutes bacterium]|nr:sugar phosphate nucleotidyltransferase [Bacillota bacterium]
MKGIILAGGLGTRFRPLSHTGPKQLVPIANKPVLYYVIEDLVEAGIKEIGIVVGYTEEKVNAIKDAVGDGSRWNCKVAYIQQDAPRGLAHAVGICRDFIGGEAFIVYLGDNILREGIVPYASEFYKSDADAYLLVAEVEEPNKYGIAVLSEAGELIDVEEKPQAPRSNLAIIGVYMFKPCIFEMIDLVQPSWRGELEITDAIRKLLRSGKYTVLARQITGWWDDTGTVEAVLNANNLILLTIKNFGIISNNAVHNSSFIPDCNIVINNRTFNFPTLNSYIMSYRCITTYI